MVVINKYIIDTRMNKEATVYDKSLFIQLKYIMTCVVL